MSGSNIKIGVRLGGGFASVLFLLGLMLVSNLYLISKIDDGLDQIITNNQVRTEMAYEAFLGVTGAANAIRTYVLSDNQAVRELALNEVAVERKHYKESVAKILELDKSDKGKEIVDKLKAAVAPAGAANNRALELSQKGERDQGIAVLVNEGLPLTRKAVDQFTELLGYEKGTSREQYAKAAEYGKNARLISIGLGIVSLVIGIIAAMMITRSITKPIAELVVHNRRLAEGDLTVDISDLGVDEIGQLAKSSRHVVDSIKQMLSMVADTSSQVASASHQLETSSRHIAAGAEEVASQTGTIATSSEEMAATSNDIARNCGMAAERSRQSSASATRGGVVVQETIAGMVRIAERVKQSAQTVESLGTRSEQIGQIVGTIEDIADQTNLLALNAAIEAARAGEQGRGFAVVADEVRALAERTTKATREISEMIAAIQKETMAAVHAMNEGVVEVEKGAATSEKSSEALEEILQLIDEVTMQISQIAAAAEEQTATTNEITKNVQQVTDIVEETARGAHDTASASSQLASNAKILQDLVGRFKLS